MTQTMFAIVALIILSLFVYHERRTTIRAQGTMVRSAVATIGNGVAVERLSKIRTLSYDEATRETFVDSPAQLTLHYNFGPSQDSPNDDVDDFDGAVKDVHRVVNSDTLSFRVESYVRYANESDPSQVSTGTIPTKYKLVAVKVYSLDLPRPDTVRIAQTISCKNACNW